MSTVTRCLLCLAVACLLPASGSGQDAEPVVAPEANVPEVVGSESGDTVVDPSGEIVADDETEVDLGPVSAVARRMLDRVRGSVVLVRGFYGTNRSEAFHGTAFAVAEDGLALTNYHVISRAALNPRDYRLEYVTDEGQVGDVSILAIDVLRDLALIRTNGFSPAPLNLRTTIPPKGDRAYAVGYPLKLGLVITEGIANGLLANEYGPKLHYAGPMNSGMSGGPALDSRGRVFGINVSISTRGQLISFQVPAEFAPPLLELANTPLAPGDIRKEVSRQLLAHQSAVMAALPAKFPTQETAGYVLPAELASFVDCTAAVGKSPIRRSLLQSVNCRADVSLLVQPGLLMGDFQYSHQVLVAGKAHPLQFSKQLERLAAGRKAAPGLADLVTPFECMSDQVNLNRFKAAVMLCARSYRTYEGLYDVTMIVTSLNHPRQGFVSSLNLRGVDYARAMDFSGRYLRAMQWTQ